MAGEQKKTVLRQQEKFKLYDYVRNNIADYLKRRPHKADLAKEISEKLGFNVEAYDVNMTCRVLGQNWIPLRGSNGKQPRERLQINKQKWEAVVKLMNHFCKELNVPMPDELKEET